MPYDVIKRGDKFVVQKSDGSKTFGTHDTKEDADRQLAALYATEKRSAESRSLHLLSALGQITTEMIGNREHFVIPVVALMEGVIHAVNAETPEYVSADLLKQAAETWNKKPGMLYHPKKDGKQCSAQDPTLIASSGIGTLRNARVEGKKLLIDALVDKARTKELHPGLYVDLEAGKPVEVSVGALVITDKKPGVYHGKPYKASWTFAEGDHLAFLPGGRGACSLEMGCGAHRAAMLVTAEGFEDVIEDRDLGDTPGHAFHGNQWKDGELAAHADYPANRVKIVGKVQHEGKIGKLHNVVGHFGSVTDAKGNKLGTYHESNLKALQEENELETLGGKGSGNFSHGGRPGEIGGSGEGGGDKSGDGKEIGGYKKLGDQKKGDIVTLKDGTKFTIENPRGTVAGIPAVYVRYHDNRDLSLPHHFGKGNAEWLQAPYVIINSKSVIRHAEKTMLVLDGGPMPDKSQVEVQGGRMKIGDKVKINKPGHDAHGKTGTITASDEKGHTVGDHGKFQASELRAAEQSIIDPETLRVLRDIPQSERDKMSESDFAGPDQSFPIKTQADVDAASHLVGKAKDPAAVKARIIAIAKKKGLTLPEAWNVKAAAAADADPEEQAELIAYQTMRSTWDACDTQWDQVSTIIDDLIAAETDDATETEEEEAAEEQVETAQIESIRTILMGMIGQLNGLVNLTYGNSLSDAPRYMEDRTLAGARHSAGDAKLIQAVHDHAMNLGAACDRGNMKTMEAHDNRLVNDDNPTRRYIATVLSTKQKVG